MSNEEIALELVKAWSFQTGCTDTTRRYTMYEVLDRYDQALKHVEDIDELKRKEALNYWEDLTKGKE